MRNAITWQTVAAPDFSDALAGARQSQIALNDAFDIAVQTAGDFRQGQKERASSAALTKALAITDPAEFARAVSSGELGDSRNFTTEFQDFLAGQRSSLLGDQQTVLQNEAQRFRNSRAPIEAAQDDWTFNFGKEGSIYQRDRNRQSDQREDLARELGTTAIAVADQIMAPTASREEAITDLYRRNLDPVTEAAVLEQINEKPDSFWQASDVLKQGLMQPENSPFRIVGEGIDSYRAAQNVGYSQNADLRLWSAAIEQFDGIDNPILSVIDKRFGDNEGSINPLTTKESNTLNETRNSVISSYDTLVRKYKDIPPEVIARLVDQNLESGGLLSGGKLEVAMDRVEARLEAMNTPEKRALLESQRQDYNRKNAQLNAYETQFDQAVQRAALAQRNRDREGFQEANKEIQDLLTQFTVWKNANPNSAYDQDKFIEESLGTRRRGDR